MLWVKIIRESRAVAAGRRDAAAEASREGSSLAPRAARLLRPGRDLSWLHGRQAGRSSRCRSPSVRGLMAELGVSRDGRHACSCAGGSAIPTAARAFLEPEGISHDPLLLGDMAAAVERLRAAVDARRADLRPRRLRRRRDLRHGARGPDAERARRGRRLAPPEPVRGGLRRLGRDDRAPRRGGREAHPHRRLRHHRRRRGRGGAAARRRHDRHRPPPARRDAARLPDRRHAALRLPVPRPLRHRCRRQARPGAPRRRPPGARPPRRPGRARHDRRRRAARRREPRARDDGPPRPLAHPEARACGTDARRGRRPGDDRRDRGRVPARAAASTRPAGSAGPTSRCTSCSPRTRARPICSRTSSRRSTATARRSRRGSCARPSPRSRRGRPSSAAAAPTSSGARAGTRA